MDNECQQHPPAIPAMIIPINVKLIQDVLKGMKRIKCIWMGENENRYPNPYQPDWSTNKKFLFHSVHGYFYPCFSIKTIFQCFSISNIAAQFLLKSISSCLASCCQTKKLKEMFLFFFPHKGKRRIEAPINWNCVAEVTHV